MKRIEFLVFLSIFIFLVTLALNRHSKAGIYNYHSEIYADKAGYNVYLPATFIYSFNANAFPDSIDIKTGNGFRLDKTNNKVITKYPYGVALLQAPFWLIAYFIDRDKTGYSKTFHSAVDVSAVFYLVIGIFFIYKILKSKLKILSIILVIFISLCASNLLYYSTIDNGMPHVYSFSILSIVLYAINRNKSSIIIFFLASIFVLIRPVNLIFILPILFLFEIENLNDFRNRIYYIFNFRNILIVIVPVVLLFLMQIRYYNYAFEDSIGNIYANEHFSFILRPKILEVLFAPNNGLFIYSPIVLVIILFILRSDTILIQKCFIIGLFVIYVVLYGSWWSYMLGCGFGHRGFLDIFPIFIVVFSKWFNDISVFKIAFCLTLSVYVLRLYFSYDVCFFGKSEWDWHELFQLLVY